jgi:hypothetical protein
MQAYDAQSTREITIVLPNPINMDPLSDEQVRNFVDGEPRCGASCIPREASCDATDAGSD